MSVGRWRDLLNDALEGIAYVLAHAPSFPMEDHTSTEVELRAIEAALRAAQERIDSPDRRQWLTVSLGELATVLEHFRNGNLDNAFSLLQSAEEHIRSALRGTKIRARFITGTDGRTYDQGG